MGNNSQKLQPKPLSDQEALELLQPHVYDPNSKKRDTINDGFNFLTDFELIEKEQLDEQDEGDLFFKI